MSDADSGLALSDGCVSDHTENADETADAPEEPVVRTRSGRVVKKPSSYSPKEACEDDYDAGDYDSADDANSPGSSVEYGSEEGGSSQDEYDSDFVAESEESVEENTDEDEEVSETESEEEEEYDSDDLVESEGSTDHDIEKPKKKKAKVVK